MSQLLIYFKCQIKVYFVHACELNAFRVDSSVALKHVNYLHVQMTVMFHKFYKKIKIKIKGGGGELHVLPAESAATQAHNKLYVGW